MTDISSQRRLIPPQASMSNISLVQGAHVLKGDICSWQGVQHTMFMYSYYSPRERKASRPRPAMCLTHFVVLCYSYLTFHTTSFKVFWDSSLHLGLKWLLNKERRHLWLWANICFGSEAPAFRDAEKQHVIAFWTWQVSLVKEDKEMLRPCWLWQAEVHRCGGVATWVQLIGGDWQWSTA